MVNNKKDGSISWRSNSAYKNRATHAIASMKQTMLMIEFMRLMLFAVLRVEPLVIGETVDVSV
jgi:hypothetical protein